MKDCHDCRGLGAQRTSSFKLADSELSRDGAAVGAPDSSSPRVLVSAAGDSCRPITVAVEECIRKRYRKDRMG